MENRAPKKKGNVVTRNLGRAMSFTFGAKKPPSPLERGTFQGADDHNVSSSSLGSDSDSQGYNGNGGSSISFNSSHGHSVDEEARRLAEEAAEKLQRRAEGAFNAHGSLQAIFTKQTEKAKEAASKKMGALKDVDTRQDVAARLVTDFIRNKKDIKNGLKKHSDVVSLGATASGVVKAKLKDALTGELGNHTKLLKEVLTAKNHHEAIDKIHDEILERLVPLAEDASEKKLEEFKEWFDVMVESHKKDFPEENWIWNDAVKPVLKALVGIIVAVVTAIFMPFVSGLYGHVYTTFFTKPDTAGFKAFSEKAADVKNKVVNDTDITVDSINILSPGLGT